MSRRSRIARDLVGVLLLVQLLGLRQASATQTGSEQTYQVVAGCPNRSQWIARLRARLPEPLRARAEQRGFQVEIERDAVSEASSALYTGRISSESALPGEARSVTGASCGEVVDALTLIAALELQQSAPDAKAPLPVDQSSDIDRARDSASGERSERDPGALRVGAIGFALVQSLTAPRLSTDLGVGVSLRWQTDMLQPWLMLGVYVGNDDVASPGARCQRCRSRPPLRHPRRRNSRPPTLS